MIKVNKSTKIVVCGDIHSHPEQFFNLLDIVKPSENVWFVSVGDIYDKGFGNGPAEQITDELIQLNYKKICFAVPGNHELKLIRKNKNNLSHQLRWWKSRPLSLSFEFYNGNILTVVHAGVTPKHNWKDLESNTEVCYVRDIDDVGNMIPLHWKMINGKQTLVKAKDNGLSWHELYDGRFGYIVSGHNAQYDGQAKFYKFSCNLDSCVYNTGILTAQIFDSNGKLSETIRISGPAAKPELNLGY